MLSHCFFFCGCRVSVVGLYQISSFPLNLPNIFEEFLSIRIASTLVSPDPLFAGLHSTVMTSLLRRIGVVAIISTAGIAVMRTKDVLLVNFNLNYPLYFQCMDKSRGFN